jgi:SAM-dependent methyltransferase
MVGLRKRLRHIFQERYGRLKENYLGSRAPAIPAEYRSNFVSYKGASDLQFILAEAIPAAARRILVIGVFGGRDYFFFKTRGNHEVHALDLQAMPGFENLKIANIEEPLPYPNKFFDAIVMNEVIEHLIEDAKALKNVRNVLADDGILFLSVPFLHEREEGHVRVHMRQSVIRLLSCCGFAPFDIMERPGLGFFLPWVNALNFAASALTFALARRTVYPVTLPLLGRLEQWSGRRPNPLRRMSSGWGGYFVCRKSAATFNYVAQNRDAYGPKASPEAPQAS